MSELENNVSYDPTPEKPQKPKKKHVVGKIILILLLCLIVGFPAYYGVKQLVYKYTPSYNEGGIGGLAGAIGSDITSSEQSVPSEVPSTDVPKQTPDAKPSSAPEKETPSPIEKSDTSVSGTVLSEEAIFENNVDSVVSISTTLEGYNYFGQKVQGAASGSGFIVTEDGYILTNYHVIEGSSSITVTTYNGDEYPASIRGYDSSNDIAVLKIEADNLTPVTLGDSDQLKPGQHVVAIGNALGQYGFSITEGIISGLARDVKVDKNLTMSLIQTDCAINSGNSGGPLFNMYGEVIGITNAKLSSSSSSSASIDNVGFAIPINSVYEIVTNIIENGGTASTADKNTPFLGISGAEISDEAKAVSGIKGGAIVAYVYDNSAASKAGIQVNDIITSVDGKEVESFESLKTLISAYKVGDEVTFGIYRAGSSMTVKAVLTAKADVDTSVTDSATQNQNNQQQAQTPNSDSYAYGNFGDFGDLYDFMNRFYN